MSPYFAASLLSKPSPRVGYFTSAPIARLEVSAPYFFHAENEKDLDNALRHGANIFIEYGSITACEASLTRISEHKPHLALSISSLSAYKLPAARAFYMHMKQRYNISERQEMPLLTCLQEATINGLVHGNLGIKGEYKNHASFDAYYTLIEQQLERPQQAEKRVEIMAWDHGSYIECAVADYGRGIDNLPLEGESYAPHGRGLAMIAELSDGLWLGDDRRILFMRFGR